MKTIPLSKGYVALIDDEDYELVSQWKWHVELCRAGRRYAQTTKVKNRMINAFRMHRLIAGCQRMDGKTVDHRNGNGLDNRRSNLRICTQRQNCMNQRMQTKPKSSRFKGVSWHKRYRKWRCYIKFHGKHVELHRCEDEEEAAIFYNVAAQLFYGEFACLNDV